MSKRILVIGPAWVGDMVLSQALYIELKKNAPDAVIDVMGPSWSLPIVARMPQIRRGIELPLGHGQFGLLQRWRLGKSLRGQYDQIIVLPRTFKAALIAFAARAPIRTGFKGELRSWMLTDARKRPKLSTVARFLSLGVDDNAKAPAIEKPHLNHCQDKGREQLQALGCDGAKPVVVMAPGAEFGSAKRWPASHYARLADLLAAEGMQSLVVGSPADAAVAEQIVAEANTTVFNACGKTSLDSVVDVIAACDSAVTNDSGLMHIAAATGRPLVAVYGSTSPALAFPISDRVNIEKLDLDCMPCAERDCPLQHHNCMQELSPQRVKDSLLGLLG